LTIQYFSTPENTKEPKLHAKGAAPVRGVVNVKAALEVNFSSQDAVFFNAAECDYTMIANKVALGKAVMAKYEQGEWQREWVVVTDLVKAGATTVAVSGAHTASIVFEATGDVERINLADASVGLTARVRVTLGIRLLPQKN
jgi:hypothetical protein